MADGGEGGGAPREDKLATVQVPTKGGEEPPSPAATAPGVNPELKDDKPKDDMVRRLPLVVSARVCG